MIYCNANYVSLITPQILDNLDNRGSPFRKCLRLLQKICGSRAVLPSTYKVSDELLATTTLPAAFGGFCDVYKGTLSGENVCIKRLGTESTRGRGPLSTSCLLRTPSTSTPNGSLLRGGSPTRITALPANESPNQCCAREHGEADAKKTSKQIDEALKLEREERKPKRKTRLNVLLLGRGESGSESARRIARMSQPSLFVRASESSLYESSLLLEGTLYGFQRNARFKNEVKIRISAGSD